MPQPPTPPAQEQLLVNLSERCFSSACNVCMHGTGILRGRQTSHHVCLSRLLNTIKQNTMQNSAIKCNTTRYNTKKYNPIQCDESQRYTIRFDTDVHAVLDLGPQVLLRLSQQLLQRFQLFHHQLSALLPWCCCCWWWWW